MIYGFNIFQVEEARKKYELLIEEWNAAQEEVAELDQKLREMEELYGF